MSGYRLINRARQLCQEQGTVELIRRGGPYVCRRSKNKMKRQIFRNPKIVNLNYKLKKSIKHRKYTSTNPYQIIWIDPIKIEHDVRHKGLPNKFGRVVGGDWDTTPEKFEDSIVYRSLKDYFDRDIAWEETDLCKKLQDSLNNNKPIRGRKDINVWDRKERIDQLYNSIKSSGYKSQRELNDSSKRHWNGRDSYHPFFDEVGVAISRDGEFMWQHHGQHRLSIAKLLNINKVPVQVLVRHADWEAKRKDIPSQISDFSSENGDDIHPDIY